MKTYIILYISLFCTHFLQAQSLEELLIEAGENHPALESKYKQYLASLEKLPQVSALPDPMLGIAPFILPVETRVGTQRLKLGISQQFPWFGTLKARKEVAAQQALEQLSELQILKNQIYFEVRKSYYRLYQLRKDEALVKENIQLLESYEQLTLQRYESNTAPLTDIFRTQIQLKDEYNHLQNLEVEDSVLLVQLNAQLGRSKTAPIQLPMALPAEYRILASELSILADSMFLHNPSLQLIEQKRNSINSQKNAVHKAGTPKFSVGLDYVLVSPIESSQVTDNGKDVLMPMVGISLPIFSAKKTKAKNRELALQLESLSYSEENISNQLYAELSKYQGQRADAKRSMEVLKEQIELSERTLNLLLESYANDGKDFEEILRLQQQLLNYQLKYNKAFTAEVMAYAGLLYLIGEG
ncbi:TolC family protein [Sediminitomix flava]|uniref:Outer membrane protein TolC n=1 Tax=Sediminitomix flava TaxID=379075 RepID=A0A315ZA84_SEDFL|nr:TolC family protein [Sediminitomix flava]PWJ40990.1 outer membrane protein TolC [Sediminitomix flava]